MFAAKGIFAGSVLVSVGIMIHGHIQLLTACPADCAQSQSTLPLVMKDKLNETDKRITPLTLLHPLDLPIEEEQNLNQTDTNHIVHIVHSKLLMFQPNLMALGKAQLELYRAICLRSLQQQSSKNFFHVLRTDPDLDPSLKGPLLKLLQESGVRHVLIAQNTPRLDLVYEHIHIAKNVTQEQVWSGNWDDFTSYLGSSTRIIETWLDSDDGLGRQFVEHIQEKALKSFAFQRHTYKWFCAKLPVEWSINNLFNLSHPDPTSSGFIMIPKTRGRVCVSAGWSALFSAEDIGSRNFTLFKNNHANIYGDNEACYKKKINNTNCVARLQLPQKEYTVLRARTPTSMYLRDVGKTERSSGEEAEYQKVTAFGVQTQEWERVQEQFGFTKSDGAQIYQHFRENVHHIAKENLHACRAKALLPCPTRVKHKLGWIIKEFSKNKTKTLT